MPTETLTWKDYQLSAIDAVIEAYAQGRSKMVLGMPTGSGKTIVTGGLLQRLLDPTSTALFLVPRKDLVSQTYEKFTRYFFETEDVGMVQGNYNQLGRRITIASIDTLNRDERLADYLTHVPGGKVDIVIPDECQYSLAPKYQKVISACLSLYGILLGLSATPYRSDRQSLQQLYTDGMAHVIDIWDLIDQGHLVDIKSYDVNMKFDPKELDLPDEQRKDVGVIKAIEDEYRYKQTYAMWKEVAYDKRTLVFAQSIDDAKGFEKYFSARGVTCAVVTGSTPDDTRTELYEGIKAGTMQMLINYNVLTTGNDIAEIECLIMGRATKNLGLWTQALGRGLRLAPWIGKTHCVVINLTSEEHTLMMFKHLFGTMTPTIKSVRELIREKQEKEREELVEELASQHTQEYRVPLTIKEVVAYQSDLLIGNGWQPVNGTHDYAKEWMFKGKPQKLIVEEVFTGGYQPVHLDHHNRHHVLSDEVVSMVKAQRLCQEYKTLKDHQFAHQKELRKPENAHLPLEEQQLAYLFQRQVPMSPKGWIAPRKMTEAHLCAKQEALIKEMTQAHYNQITAHLAKYGAHFTHAGKGRRPHSVSYKDGRVSSY